MTRSESQRAQPRVDYAAEVHILRSGGRAPIKGRSLNLSPTGVFVEASGDPSSDCPVGTKLLCDIPLPGGRRYLKGTVARRQAMASHRWGLGIRFDNLEAADQAILHALVQNGGDNSRLVKVRFEGMHEGLRSRAVVTKDGLRLRTALPFLRLTSPVGVSFIAGDTRVETHGTLEKVHLEPEPRDGIPRLAVDLALTEPLDPEEGFDPDNCPITSEFGPDEGTTEVTAPSAVELQHLSAQPTAPTFPLGPPLGTPTLVLHKTVSRERLEQETTPNPGRTLKRRSPSRIRERRPSPSPQMPVSSRNGDSGDLIGDENSNNEATVETLHVTDAGKLNPWWWVWGWPVLGVVLVSALIYDRVMVARKVSAQLASQSFALEQTRREVAQAAASARQAKGAAEATQAATLGLRAAIRRDVTAALEGHQTPSRGQASAYQASPAARTKGAPGFVITGSMAEASVPISGSTEGMIQYSLKAPPGVVVQLPHATSALPPGQYWIRNGGFKLVSVQERDEGVAFRFVYDSRVPRQELLEVIEAGLNKNGQGSVRVRLRQP